MKGWWTRPESNRSLLRASPERHERERGRRAPGHRTANLVLGVGESRVVSRFPALALLLVAFAASDVLTQTPATAPQPEAAPLADLRVPPGFKISVFASNLQGARLMAVSPEGVLLVARRRTNEVVALPDRDKNGVAEPEVILTGLTNAHSLAFKDGYLYIATTPAIMRVKWAGGRPCGRAGDFRRAAEFHAVAARVADHPRRPRRPAIRVDRLVVQRVPRAGSAANDDPGVHQRREARAVRDRTPQRDRVRLGSGDRQDVGHRHRGRTATDPITRRTRSTWSRRAGTTAIPFSSATTFPTTCPN